MKSYFKDMSTAIHNQGGPVLQYISDEIYAVFGAPSSQPEHPQKTFRAGLEMNRRLDDLNRQFEEKGWPCLRHDLLASTKAFPSSSLDDRGPVQEAFA
jgi:adenylate cyclase